MYTTRKTLRRAVPVQYVPLITKTLIQDFPEVRIGTFRYVLSAYRAVSAKSQTNTGYFVVCVEGISPGKLRTLDDAHPYTYRFPWKFRLNHYNNLKNYYYKNTYYTYYTYSINFILTFCVKRGFFFLWPRFKIF